MNAIHSPLHSVRKTFGVEAKPPIRTMSVKKAVVDVHIHIPGILESIRRHCLGHANDNVLRDVLGERIPAGPTHKRGLRIGRCHGLCHLEKHLGASLHLSLALRRDAAHVHERIAPILGYANTLVALGAFDEIDGREQCGGECAYHVSVSD